MQFPGFDRLYIVHDPVANRPYRGRFHPHDHSLALSRGEQPAEVRVSIEWEMGSPTPGDVIWTTSGNPIILHASVIEVWQRNGFNGWSTYPVEVRTKTGKLAPDYLGLIIHGRCAPQDPARSEITLRELPGGWFPHFLGCYFAPDSWDGTDIFMERPDSTGQVSSLRFVTEPVVDAMRKANVRNISFGRLSEDSIDVSAFTIGRRHRLPPDFEDRVNAAYHAAGVSRPDCV